MTSYNLPNPWEVDSLRAFLYLKCPECDFDSKTDETFREHALEHHPLSFVLFGKICVEEKSVFDEHMKGGIRIKKELPDDEQHYTIGEEDYHDAKEYVQYEQGYVQNEHNNDNVKKEEQTCSICDAVFARPYELKRHVSSVHENKRPFKCTECEQSFKVKHHLKRHFGRAHKDKILPVIKQEPYETSYIEEEQYGEQWDYSAFCETNLEDVANDYMNNIKTEGSSFENNQLESNSENKGEKKIFTCKLCGTGFSRTNSLKRHVLSIHEKQRPHSCTQCNEKFKLKYHLTKHIERAHEGKKAPRCEICSARFKQDQDLIFHMTLHEGKDPLQCPYCDDRFEKKNAMTFHIGTLHEGKKPHPCNICEMKFTEFNVLKNHLAKVHKPHDCDQCGATFNDKHKLKKHMNELHEGLRPYLCTLCGEKYTTNACLRRHISTVHEGIKPFQCHMCDTKFAEKSKMRRHIETVHEGIKSHLCTICGTGFPCSRNLKRHIKAVHIKDKSFTCGLCDLKFSRKDHLKQHSSAVHDGIKPPPRCPKNIPHPSTIERLPLPIEHPVNLMLFPRMNE